MSEVYKAVSTAEKRQILDDQGLPWPVCDCHGLPKLWNKSPYRVPGGTWGLRCSFSKRRIRQRETPGTYRYYHVYIAPIEATIEKYTPGTEAYQENYERIQREWQTNYAEQS